ncbi:MAG: DUF4392 domain-containing protein [Nitrososphaerota archaeon]
MSVVDRIVTVDYGGRGVVSKLYEAAYKVAGGPLCLTAAKALHKRVSDGGTVLIATGFRILRYGGAYEVDGLVSSSILARVLSEDFGAKVGMVVDEGFGPIIGALVRGAGATPEILELPIDRDRGGKVFSRFLDMLSPSIMVAVERPGANLKGVYHNSRGQDISHLHAQTDIFLERLRAADVPLIAVGDGGNEAGMAVVRSAVEDFVPYGRVCQCGCGGGIASTTGCDYPVISSVSDLGVYGVLTHLLTPDKMSWVETAMERVLVRALEMGCVDAIHGPSFIGVDGVDIYSLKAVLGLLRRAAEEFYPQ